MPDVPQLLKGYTPGEGELPGEVVTLFSMTRSSDHLSTLQDLASSDSFNTRMSAVRCLYPALVKHYGEDAVGEYRAALEGVVKQLVPDVPQLLKGYTPGEGEVPAEVTTIFSLTTAADYPPMLIELAASDSFASRMLVLKTLHPTLRAHYGDQCFANHREKLKVVGLQTSKDVPQLLKRHVHNRWVLQPDKTHADLQAAVVYHSTDKPDSDGEVQLELPGGQETDDITVSDWIMPAEIPRDLGLPAEVVVVFSMTTAADHLPVLTALMSSNSFTTRVHALATYTALLVEYGRNELSSHREVLKPLIAELPALLQQLTAGPHIKALLDMWPGEAADAVRLPIGGVGSHPNSFLFGYASDCVYWDLKSATKACLEDPVAKGITEERPGRFTLRATSDLKESPSGETSWLKSELLGGEGNSNKDRPLHLAISLNHTDEVVTALMMLYPSAVHQKGHNGLTPLAMLVNKKQKMTTGWRHAPSSKTPSTMLRFFIATAPGGELNTADLRSCFEDDNDAELTTQNGPGQEQHNGTWRHRWLQELLDAVPIADAPDVDAGRQATGTGPPTPELCEGWTALEIALDLKAFNCFFWLLEQRQAGGLWSSRTAVPHGDPEFADRRVVRAARESRNPRVKEWGTKYGLLLELYDVPLGPVQHVSDTCVVANATLNGAPVVIKLMLDEEAFNREIKCREDLPDSDFIIPTLASHTDVAPADLAPFPQLRLAGAAGAQNLPYLLVMPCGVGGDLFDVMAHANVAGKDAFAVRAIAVDIAKCLQFLHERGVMHGDIKSRNLVSLGPGKGYAVIDLDAAATIDGIQLAGEKQTSSSCLPPEQAAVLLHHELSQQRPLADYADKLGRLRAEEAALTTTSPSRDRLRDQIADLEPIVAVMDAATRPQRIKAGTAYDMWCFGVLLYELCTGFSLFRSDIRENVVDNTVLAKIAAWTDALKAKQLGKVKPEFPVKLLERLLHKDPALRPTDWGLVIRSLQGDRTAARNGAAVRNAPGFWNVFISHTQRNGNATAAAARIEASLGALGLSCWLDTHMDDKSTAAMEEGVTCSDCVVAIITGDCVNPDRPDDDPEQNAYLRRQFCISELRWARRNGVWIQPVIMASDKPNIGALVSAAPDDLRDIGDIEFITLDLFDRDYFDAAIQKIIRRCGLEASGDPPAAATTAAETGTIRVSSTVVSGGDEAGAIDSVFTDGDDPNSANPRPDTPSRIMSAPVSLMLTTSTAATAAALPPGDTTLPAGGGSEWDYYLSYTTESGHAATAAAELHADLVGQRHRCWFDAEVADSSAAAREQAVRRSCWVLAIVTGASVSAANPDAAPGTNSYFQQQGCLQELRWAREAGVGIQPLVRASDTTNAAVMFGEAPAGMLDPGTAPIMLDRSDREYWLVGVTKVLRACPVLPQQDTESPKLGGVMVASSGSNIDGGDLKAIIAAAVAKATADFSGRMAKRDAENAELSAKISELMAEHSPCEQHSEHALHRQPELAEVMKAG